MKLYREVDAGTDKSFMVIHGEHRYSMVIEPIEITEEEIQGFITESEDAYGRPASLAVEIGISWIMDKLNESK